MYKLILLFVIIATAHTQLTSRGSCNFSMLTQQEVIKSNNTVVQTFFEVERIKNNWNSGQCAAWQIRSVNGSMSIRRREVVRRRVIVRNATVSRNTDRLNVTFPDFNSNFTFIGSGDEFVVLYACSNRGRNKQEYAWVLGRNRTLSSSARRATQNIIQRNNLNKAKSWARTSHSTASCRSGGTNIKLSPIIVLIVGFLVAKRL